MKSWISLLAAIPLASSAQATVVELPIEIYDEAEEIGEIELVSEVRTPDGEPCDDAMAPPCSLERMAASWASQEVPVQVELWRNRNGYTIVLLSTLSDRKARWPCWLAEPVDLSGALTPRKLWKELRTRVESWATSCSPIRAVGVDNVLAAFTKRERDFRRAFIRIAALPEGRLSGEEEGTSVGSFLPTRVTQGILDAIADACEGPRDRLRLRSDGSIDWIPDYTIPYGADGSLPFDSCVDLQIKYLPGYPKRS